jgi:hypothetical protein
MEILLMNSFDTEGDFMMGEVRGDFEEKLWEAKGNGGKVFMSKMSGRQEE